MTLKSVQLLSELNMMLFSITQFSACILREYLISYIIENRTTDTRTINRFLPKQTRTSGGFTHCVNYRQQ